MSAKSKTAIGGGAAVWVLLLFEWLEHWAQLDTLVSKFHDSGPIGQYIAGVLLAPVTLFIIGGGALFVGIKGLLGQESTIDSSAPTRVEAAGGTATGGTASSSANVGSTTLTANPHIEAHIHLPNGSAPAAPNPKIETSKKQEPTTLDLLHLTPIHLEKDAGDRFFDLQDGVQNGFIAEFRNTPRPVGRTTPRINRVTAHLCFVGNSIPAPVHISHGTWMGRNPNYAYFNSGQTYKLIIAVRGFKRRGKDLPFEAIENPLSYEPDGWHVPPLKHVELPDQQSGRLEVTLTDDNGVTLYQETFEYGCSDAMFMLKAPHQPLGAGPRT